MDLKLNEKEINTAIFSFWNNYLNFKYIPVKGENILLSNFNKELLNRKEINIIVFKNKGVVFSISESIYQDVYDIFSDTRNSIDELVCKIKILKKRKVKKIGPVLSFYLFSTKKLKKRNNNFRELIGSSDKKLFDKYINSCSKEELSKVDIRFGEENYKTFGLFVDSKIVSIGNYSIDLPTGISHIGILTKLSKTRKGYGMELVNNITLNILDNNLIPQYRVEYNNMGSIKIAEGLGFTPVLEGITLKID